MDLSTPFHCAGEREKAAVKAGLCCAAADQLTALGRPTKVECGDGGGGGTRPGFRRRLPASTRYDKYVSCIHLTLIVAAHVAPKCLFLG